MTLTDADLEAHVKLLMAMVDSGKSRIEMRDGHGDLGVAVIDVMDAAAVCVRVLVEARAALARVKALCEQAVAEYQPHDVTPWVAVHELRAAMAGE